VHEAVVDETDHAPLHTRAHQHEMARAPSCSSLPRRRLTATTSGADILVTCGLVLRTYCMSRGLSCAHTARTSPTKWRPRATRDAHTVPAQTAAARPTHLAERGMHHQSATQHWRPTTQANQQ
jgi:hypothetical protein